MRYVKLFVAVLAFLLLSTLGVYAQESKQEPAGAAPDAKQQAATPEAKRGGHDQGAMREKRFVATVGPDGVQHVEITGGKYYFKPSNIVVKVNVPVEFVVKKEPGYVPHNIMVKAPEAGIDFKVDLKKEPTTIKFTPKKVGKYEMFCDKQLLFFTSHRDRGMEGVIEVVE